MAVCFYCHCASLSTGCGCLRCPVHFPVQGTSKERAVLSSTNMTRITPHCPQSRTHSTDGSVSNGNHCPEDSSPPPCSKRARLGPMRGAKAPLDCTHQDLVFYEVKRFYFAPPSHPPLSSSFHPLLPHIHLTPSLPQTHLTLHSPNTFNPFTPQTHLNPAPPNTLNPFTPPHTFNPSLPPHQGVITACLYPAVGVYELDGRVRLYLTHTSSTHLCRGLRIGATLQLSNVFILRVTTGDFKVTTMIATITVVICLFLTFFF